jgi:meiotically up-regulated gene 157 (Mug157) protein
MFIYQIAANAMAVVQLQQLSIVLDLLNENTLAMSAISLAKDIDQGKPNRIYKCNVHLIP